MFLGEDLRGKIRQIGEEPSKATNLVPRFQVRGVVLMRLN